MRTRPFVFASLIVLAVSCSDKATAPTTTPAPSGPPPAWEEECPGTDREVLYDASVTMGTYTIITPSGMRQGEIYNRLHGKGAGAGLRFCMAPGSFVSIAVQNMSSSGGVNCRIQVDGTNISRNSSSGGYAIAACDGTA